MRISLPESMQRSHREGNSFSLFPAESAYSAPWIKHWVIAAGIASPGSRACFKNRGSDSITYIMSIASERLSGTSPAVSCIELVSAKFSLSLFDKTILIWRLLDPVIPWGGLSMVAVSTRL